MIYMYLQELGTWNLICGNKRTMSFVPFLLSLVQNKSERGLFVLLFCVVNLHYYDNCCMTTCIFKLSGD